MQEQTRPSTQVSLKGIVSVENFIHECNRHCPIFLNVKKIYVSTCYFDI